MNNLTTLTSSGASLIADRLFPTQISDLALGNRDGNFTFDTTLIPWRGPGFSWENDFYKIEKSMKKIFEQFSSDFVYGDSFPRINVYFDKEKLEYVIQASIAGIDKNKVNATIDSGRLIFEYTKSSEEQKEDENIQYFFREMSTSSFKKIIKIPESADFEKLKNSYEDGVMKIVFPIKESSKPKKLNF